MTLYYFKKFSIHAPRNHLKSKYPLFYHASTLPTATPRRHLVLCPCRRLRSAAVVCSFASSSILSFFSAGGSFSQFQLNLFGKKKISRPPFLPRFNPPDSHSMAPPCSVSLPPTPERSGRLFVRIVVNLSKLFFSCRLLIFN